MIGPDYGGTLWSIPIRPVNGKPGVWRAVTAMSLVADDDDMSWYQKQMRKGRKK
jgi:hypothetical protein